MSVTWLHISDFHVRGGDPYDRDVVLRALVQSVAKYRAQGRAPDVIFATGDIAFSGKAKEYAIAETFFDALLEAAQLGRDRLYVIPGNHDVDRDEGEGLARTLDSREKSDKYFHPERPKPHLTQKMRAYVDWHNRFFKGIRVTPENSTCGPVESLELTGVKLGILPINSALFCEDEYDSGKLWVGRRCLDKGIEEVKQLGADLNIILMHHPLDWLHPVEAENVQVALERLGHVLLRGHLHVTRIETVSSADGELLRIAAGAAYDTRKWPMRAMYGTLDKNCVTIFPIRYEDAPAEKWTIDPSAFPDGGEKTFEVKRAAAATVVAPKQPAAVEQGFRSNISARGNFPFVGREAVMLAIDAALKDPGHEGVVVLHGQAGAGKTAAAREFARQHGDRYPGGTFLVDATKEAIAINLAQIGKVILDMDFGSGLTIDEQGLQTFYALGKSQALLVYDNVQSFERIRPWLPLAGMPCHALVTTLEDIWNVTWPVVEVKPLSVKQSFELVDKLTGGELPKEVVEKIVKEAGGLPVQLVPSATTMANAKRRGLLKATAPLALAAEAKGSFGGAYGRLEQPAKILLHAATTLTPERIPMAELTLHLTEGLGWSDTKVERTLETCFELHLLEGAPDPSMHQLFARYLREMELEEEWTEELGRVRKAQARRFVKLAEAVQSNPADVVSVGILLNYPLLPAAWESLGEPLAGDEGKTTGRALFETGRFVQAKAWFERAVAEAEKGDGNGRVDHDSLGGSLHQVGFCLSSVGEYAAAKPWYERAVAEAEKGDVHGRVDHESLGRSLYLVGFCLSSVGEYPAAKPWFERAVAEAEKGDVHGRVDHESLGKSLHLVGFCLSSVGEHAAAKPWYERAVAEAEKGDVHGRVDHESSGKSLHLVGFCLSSVGEYAAAKPWYERAVAEAEKGDVHGRVNHGSLGGSLHQVGFCLSSVGEYAAAKPWYERAVAEKEKGDVHGRVDHESLGKSLHLVGFCSSSEGEYAAAKPWFERAVAEKEKGDVHGRVDHESLGKSLHLVGFCLSSVGEYAEARPWFERAVAEAEKGDVHGRVDHESLGASVHQVGGCLSSVGEYAAAKPWYKRAVAEKEKGDVHGRVNHESLGLSVHQVGFCLFKGEAFREALDWFERAAMEREKGDIFGRVDHGKVARSMDAAAECLLRLGREDESQEWRERAGAARASA